MNDWENKVREAFDDIVLPEAVKAKTLQAVEERALEPEPAVSASVAAAARRAKTPRTRRFAFALAACLALCAIGFGGFTAFASETAQVGIDVNPSIELGLNRFDRVVAVRSLNDDGQRLLDGVELVGKSYDEAMAALTESEQFKAYATADGYIEISVTSNDAEQAETLTRKSDACLQAMPGHGACHTVSAENRDEALAAGMGVGRYNAALELMELDPNVTLDECRSMSMRELRDRIAEAGGEPSEESGQHHGQGMGGEHGQGMGNGQGAGNGQGRQRGRS
ncbi:anti-sigma-I factor RsgI family protein [Raoultibacter phocaeensis]|uniref:anti-sigma-I factor RsgI family protein n=1 Tax=Raoultibacter phocaeensis TaxID=2479841 RepID=UPI0011194C3B|nr:hypothetical protein [Raoultibacter phocaeensis]